MDINGILQQAKNRGASDVHFVKGLKPVLRINRELIVLNELSVITEGEIWDAYDFFLKGNLEKDRTFKARKVLDCSEKFQDIRLRINVSYSDGVPVITVRLIRNELPTFEELRIPDVVRRMMAQSQGIILVTGKTNSGKTTTLNALINYINENENKKILTLENPVEYKHTSKKSMIIQKEVGAGGDMPSFSIGTKNSLREDCDILVIGEIRDKETLEAAIETAESGHLVLGTLHTKSCAETIDRMVNFYEVKEQTTIKYLLASLLKLVISQRLIRNKMGTLTLVPEVMVVDNVVAGIIKKEKLNVSEIEDAIQSSAGNGSIGLINSLAELVISDEISLNQAEAQTEEKNIELLKRTIKQLKIKKENPNSAMYNNYN